ncbi:HU family DNA-binding protein [Methylotenera sp.]
MQINAQTAYDSRNPANGETLKISASNHVSFSVVVTLKSVVNQ